MLHAYGENGFTFLLFNHLHDNGDLVKPFLSNLKQFSTRTTFASKHRNAFDGEQNHEDPEVWLFPNFGKSQGFGEPDAIVLFGEFSFWIEVETDFNLIRKRTAARNALVQLLRFHYFNQALINRRQRRKENDPHFAIVGPTISGNGTAKLGILRVAGHGVLKEIEDRLADSASMGKDHYILLSDRKMVGVTTKAEDGMSNLHSLFESCVSDLHHKVVGLSQLVSHSLAKPCVSRFWYQYSEGDLKRYSRSDFDSKTTRYVRKKNC